MAVNLKDLKTWWALRRDGAVARLAVVWLVVCGVIGGAGWLGWLERVELLLYDTVIAYTANGADAPPIVLVGANDEDLKRFGWPLPDDRLVAAIESIAEAGAVAIGVDLYRDRPVGGGEEVLGDLLRRRTNVVFVSKLSSARQAAIEAPRAIRGSNQVGFADIPIDDDGVTRRALLFAEDEGRSQTAFPMRLALRALEARGIRPERAGDGGRIRLGAGSLRPISDAEGPYFGVDSGGYQVLIDFRDNPDAFRRFSVADVLDGRAAAQNFKGKVVIVGTASQSVKDFFTVPANRIRGDRQVFGIEVHAQVVAQLMRLAAGEGRQLLGLPRPLGAFWIALLAACAVVAGWRLNRLPLLIAAGAGGALVIAAVHGALYAAGWWLALVPALLAWFGAMGVAIAYSMHHQSQQRKQLMSLFSRYFSRDVAEQIWARRDEVLDSRGMPAPQQMVATVFFCDLAGFTSKAEVLAPKELTELLNAYFEAAVSIIHRNGGSVDKFIGDAVMAVFGLPIPRRCKDEIFDDARRAVAAALEFATAIDKLNEAYKSAGLPAIAVRMGIHTGPVVAGSIGSPQRMEYTVIGDTVNVAARLEGLDKAGRGDRSSRILVSETTRYCLDPSFAVERLGEFRLQGKREAVEVFHVLGRIPAPAEAAP